MGRPDARFVGKHIQRAHAIHGEHQIPEYVSSLSLGECAEILDASPVGLPSLAAHSEPCRVGAAESRDFAEVIRTWTVHVLSSLEGG